MFHGRLLAIAICPATGTPMQGVEAVEALAGRGLASDRYALGTGVGHQGEIKPDQAITLIELEAIEAAAQDYSLSFAHLDTRRNLLTSAVPLNHLVGREFQVGEVVLRGVELCEPCGHLERQTCAGIKKALLHRGGLRAQIVRGGSLSVGAAIRPVAG
jgi:MOSC domain-containing protein YiiM